MMNRFINIEAEKCIGCRTCEIACAVAHTEEAMTLDSFFPRLTVIKGMKVTTPVVCHHCENAPCMSVCAPNAIIRDKNSIQVIQERCIGCKSCVIACPFGAIEIATIDDKSHALKCDLCIDQESGPTCVSVCPTNALSLFEAKDLKKLMLEKQKQTAMATLF